MARFELKILWKGSRKAALTSIEHNGITIRSVNATPLVGSGSVAVRYDVAPASVHRVRFTLVFPGQKLKEFEAWGKPTGEGKKRIKKEKKERSHYWYATGTYR